MRDVANILFGAAFTVAVSLALGSLLLDRLRLTLYRFEAGVIAFIAGAGCLSFLTALRAAASSFGADWRPSARPFEAAGAGNGAASFPPWISTG